MHDIGEVFAGFTIEAMLGQGGMGTVYLARHPRLDRLTALKLLNRDLFADERIRARFEREADLAAGLDHPGIVTVFDRGTEGEQLWISMQYVDGIDAATVDPMALPPERAVQIIEGVADALDYAHGRGVLHRDVKPANILLARSTGGAGERVFLTDFGIARLRADSTHLTQQGMFTATLAYASPEQMTGAELDHRSDQYSLACSLYWMFTGSAPFDSADPNEIIRGTLYAAPPPLALRRAGLPPMMDAVLAAAMAKHPAARFDSCVAFATAARQALTSKTPPVLPRPPANSPPVYYPPAPQQGPAAPFAQPGMMAPGYQASPAPPAPQPQWQAPPPPLGAVPPAGQRPAAPSVAVPPGEVVQRPAAGPVAAQPNMRQSPPGAPQPAAAPPAASSAAVAPTDLPSSAGGRRAHGEHGEAAIPAPGGDSAIPSSAISLDKPLSTGARPDDSRAPVGTDSGEVSATASTDVVPMGDAGELDAANAAALTTVTSIAGASKAAPAGPVASDEVAGQSSQAGQQDGAAQSAAGHAGVVGQSGAVGQSSAAGQAGVVGQSGAGGEPSAAGRAGDVGQPSAANQASAAGQSSAAGQAGAMGQPGAVGHLGAAGQLGIAGQLGAAGQQAEVGRSVAAGQPGGAVVPGGAGAQHGGVRPGPRGPWAVPHRGYWPVPRRVSGMQRFGWVLLVALVVVLVALVVALVVVVLPGDDDEPEVASGASGPSNSVAEVADSFGESRRVFPTLVPQGEMSDGVGYRGARCRGVRDVSELAWKEPALQWTPITSGWQCERADNQPGAVSYLVLEYASASQARSVSEALPATVRYAGDKDGVPYWLQRWTVQDPASTRVQTAHQTMSFPDDSERANYLVVVSRRGSSGTGGAPRPSAQDEVIAWWVDVPL
ncbi:protein kinase [Nocardia sp. NPDC058633]|uniref:protein kinase domain-containing protein n=1 Tax=Nocardia sp. NPDC058633 TaxID=3346568 RepID=UPI003667D5A7